MTARTLGLSGACLASIGRDMPRAEALLLEAETLASRTGVELTDVPMGLGIVRYFDADHAEAARHLEHGLRLARREHDHFRECECLTVLVMLALESRAPERALTLCRELAPVAARLKGGSEAPFSRALEALARYAMGEDEADDDLAGALDALRRLDASRKRAYVLTMAAEADLETGRVDTAVERADAALEAAGVVQDTSGMALAGATLARALLARGERERARNEMTVLQSDLGEEEGLSARARVTLDAVARRLSLAARSDP